MHLHRCTVSYPRGAVPCEPQQSHSEYPLLRAPHGRPAVAHAGRHPVVAAPCLAPACVSTPPPHADFGSASAAAFRSKYASYLASCLPASTRRRCSRFFLRAMRFSWGLRTILGNSCRAARDRNVATRGEGVRARARHTPNPPPPPFLVGAPHLFGLALLRALELGEAEDLLPQRARLRLLLERLGRLKCLGATSGTGRAVGSRKRGRARGRAQHESSARPRDRPRMPPTR
eukprot:2898381-Prymnesium_polylepis.1